MYLLLLPLPSDVVFVVGVGVVVFVVVVVGGVVVSRIGSGSGVVVEVIVAGCCCCCYCYSLLLSSWLLRSLRCQEHDCLELELAELMDEEEKAEATMEKQLEGAKAQYDAETTDLRATLKQAHNSAEAAANITAPQRAHAVDRAAVNVKPELSDSTEPADVVIAQLCKVATAISSAASAMAHQASRSACNDEEEASQFRTEVESLRAEGMTEAEETELVEAWESDTGRQQQQQQQQQHQRQQQQQRRRRRQRRQQQQQAAAAVGVGS